MLLSLKSRKRAFDRFRQHQTSDHIVQCQNEILAQLSRKLYDSAAFEELIDFIYSRMLSHFPLSSPFIEIKISKHGGCSRYSAGTLSEQQGSLQGVTQQDFMRRSMATGDVLVFSQGRYLTRQRLGQVTGVVWIAVPFILEEQVVGVLGGSWPALRPQECEKLIDLMVMVSGLISVALSAMERTQGGRAGGIEASQQLQTFFNAIHDAIFIHSFQEEGFGNILEVNDVACSRYGFSRDQFLEMTVESFNAPEHIVQRGNRKTRKKLLERGQDFFNAVHRNKDGEEFPVEINSTIFEQNGRKLIMSVARDISERMNAQKEQRKLEERLGQAQKLEAIGTLAGGIAHDFNNILAAMLGHTELIRFRLEPDSSCRPSVERVLEAGGRAKDLIQQILLFSRNAKLKCSIFRPVPLVREAMKILRSTLPSIHEIELNLDEQTAAVLVNPVQMQQVLINLVINSSQAIGDRSGKIIISISQSFFSASDLIYHPQAKAGHYVRFSISDNGAGIDPEVVEKIFEPYFTTKKVGEGTGLGLSIVHGIVKNFGGFMAVYSEPGDGASMHVFLPAVDDEGAVIEAADDDCLPQGCEHVLYVDDESMLTELGVQMLQGLGYEVVATNRSEEALELFRQAPDQFDIVISDQTMPGMTGICLAEELKAIRADIPVVLCTGFSANLGPEKLRKSGVEELLVKPVSMKELAVTIRRILGSLPTA